MLFGNQAEADASYGFDGDVIYRCVVEFATQVVDVHIERVLAPARDPLLAEIIDHHAPNA